MEGLRRIAVAIRVLSWVWIALFLIAAIARTSDGEFWIWVIVAILGALGLGLAWIIDGFVRK